MIVFSGNFLVRIGRVVQDTENFSFGRSANTLRMIVDFSCPEGAER